MNKNQIDNGKVFTCEKHFEPDDMRHIVVTHHFSFIFISIQLEKMAKKTPKFGALPTFSMPKRSHDMVRPVACPLKSVVEDKPKYYGSFRDLCKRVKTLKTLQEWTVQELENRLLLQKKSAVMLPEFELMIDDSLGFRISV
ncbi:hypothetical protein pdam_00000113 [Pocillopora damicornis]|uniref:THAP-type domain-containing protein n=1 Tax=Pocillopora damicornis TaxID=46731 RepID=A0A3M6UXA6_POCDA|nr:hypothetical protein pdam_00000113 [Pocillopora damicornis]